MIGIRDRHRIVRVLLLLLIFALLNCVAIKIITLVCRTRGFGNVRVFQRKATGNERNSASGSTAVSTV